MAGFVKLGINANWLLTGAGPMLIADLQAPGGAPSPAPQESTAADSAPSPEGAATAPRAADTATSLYTYRGEPSAGVLEVVPGTPALIARCIVAAEKLLGDAYTREQQATLAIDTWGALRRMFYGREAEHIAAIADTDLELLTRFVFNTKRAVNPPGK